LAIIITPVKTSRYLYNKMLGDISFNLQNLSTSPKIPIFLNKCTIFNTLTKLEIPLRCTNETQNKTPLTNIKNNIKISHIPEEDKPAHFTTSF